MPRLRVSSEFRQRCRTRVLEVFARLGLPLPVFREVSGERPSLAAQFEHQGRTHDIEIYTDDVVMLEGKSLHECYLRREFATEEALIEGFSSRLSRYLAGGSWAGPDEQGWLERFADGLRRTLGATGREMGPEDDESSTQRSHELGTPAMTNEHSSQTVFQQRFLASLRELLRSHGIGIASETLEGQTDNYARICFAHRGSTFEVFIYQDEVGFFVNGAWRILESQDYRGPADLHREALATMAAELVRTGVEKP